jgi:hypothetical protein
MASRSRWANSSTADDPGNPALLRLPALSRLSAASVRGAALAVSAGADHQAHWLMEEQGVRFPLLVDPDRRVHTALELPVGGG